MAARGTKRGRARVSLVETALKLFERHSFHAIGIDRILAEAGVAKMTLYHHFPSKDALILAVLEKSDAAFRAGFAEEVAAAARAPRERLLAMFDALDRWIREPGFRGSLFDKAAGEFADKDHPARRIVLAHKSWIFGEVRRAAAEAGAADPLRLAAEIFLLMEGAVTAATATGDRSAARRARAAAETLIDTAAPG
jgi:AcrR family transcriptional regulator